MTTSTSWLAALAALIFVCGGVFALSRRAPRVRAIGLAVTVILTALVGWIAWYIGITPAGA